MKKNLQRLLKRAQQVFNKWIRERDKFEPCISCGQYKELQVGHYVPVKGGSYLRFHEDNVHGECAGCNGFDDFHLVGYRKNLIKKIGIEKVEWLEANRRKVYKWSQSELEQIIKKYS